MKVIEVTPQPPVHKDVEITLAHEEALRLKAAIFKYNESILVELYGKLYNILKTE